MIEILLAQGADPEAKNDTGICAAEYAFDIFQEIEEKNIRLQEQQDLLSADDFYSSDSKEGEDILKNDDFSAF